MHRASASIAFPRDFIEKMGRARDASGFRYVHVLAPQPQSWGYPPDRTIQMARLAVECGLWPLMEVVEGDRRLTHRPEPRVAVRDYLRAQKRFDRVGEDEISAIQVAIDRRWS